MSGMLENGFGGHNGESLKQSPKSDMFSTESDASMLHKTSKKHLKASLSKAFLSKGMPVTFKDVVKTVGKISGDIKFGGEKPSRNFLRRYTGYVEQTDTLLPILTVEEMLLYTADLKKPISESKKSKMDAVEELLGVLALDSCRDVLIGSELARGISGGQAKRVNIGIALITNPRVLFLDEPTSGLDSFTANEVMSVVKSLALMGITVCATIHSPTPYAFSLFDRLLLLLRGGTAYFGINGSVALEYFHSVSPTDITGLREGENEAEWIVDITTLADRQGRQDDFVRAFAKSEIKLQGDKEIDHMLQKTSTLDEQTKKDLAVKRDTVTPTWWALKTLFKYRTSKNYRSPEFLGPRVMDKLIFSIIIFTLYWAIGNKLTPDNYINIAAVLFMWCTLPAFGAASYVPAIVLERPLFVRERSDGLYKSDLFNVVFWPIKFQGQWVLFWLVYYATLGCGIVVAYFVAALSPNMDVANAALPSYVVTLLFFSGFLLRWSDIPKWWQWYGYINFLRYAWGSLMVNQFGGFDSLPPFVSDPEPISILDYYSLGGVSKWAWFGIELAFFVVFFFFAFLALTYVRHVRR
ncbi:ABC transporter G family member 50 [Picochlorum sp. SENEW3]|nr:ABC transporter G family member 50 [Picochlorum sp. SENEW3]